MEPNNLAAAFGIWAAVVGLVGGGIVYELSRLRKQMDVLAQRLSELTVRFEHRLTRVETRVGIRYGENYSD